MPLTAETILHILFSADFNPKSRSAMMFAMCGERDQRDFELELWAITLNDISLNFYKKYLSRLLDEFPFVQKLRWRRYLFEEELGDPLAPALDIFVNGVAFKLFTFSRDYLHPDHVPDAALLKSQEVITDMEEWIRLLDGLVLFNDINFTFAQKYTGAIENAHFNISKDYLIELEDEAIGLGLYSDIILTRTEIGFNLATVNFDPPDPLPPK